MHAWMPGALAARSAGKLRRRGDVADSGHSSCTLALEECPRQRPVDVADDEAAGRTLIPLVSLPALMMAPGQVRSRSRGGAAGKLRQRQAPGGLTPAMGVGLLLLLAMVPRTTEGFTQTAWRPANGPPGGGTRVTILGAQYGLGSSPIGARVGGTACTDTKWTSDTSIGATVPPAHWRSDNQVVLTLATMNIRTNQGFFTFDAAVIRFARPSNAPAASDGRTLTIAGENFGWYDTSPRARVGDTTCEATNWISGSFVHCKVPSGTASDRGQDASVVVTVAQGDGAARRPYTLTNAFTYNSPVVLEVRDTGGRPNGPATGGSIITAIGLNFGMVDASIVAFVGSTRSAGIIWTSDTSIGIVLAPGVQSNRAIDLSMGDKYGAGLAGAYDYDRAAITAVTGANGPTTGGNKFTVHGFNFGASDYSPKIMVSDKFCSETSWKSDSVITCTLPENVGSSKNVALDLMGTISSFSNSYSYNAPLVTGINLGNGPPVGFERTGRMVTISGENFGASGAYLPKAYIHSPKGGGECVRTVWQSHSSLACGTPAGVGEGADVIVVVGGQAGTLVDGFSYNRPIVRIADNQPDFVANAPCNTPKELTIFGDNFGGQDYQHAVAKVGGTTCIATKWKSDSTITCTTPQGALGEQDIIVSMESMVASITKAFSFDSPTITKMLSQNGPAGAGHPVTLFGKNFGTYMASQTVFIGDSKAQPVEWTSDSAVVARAPAGRGSGQTVSVLPTENAATENANGGIHLKFYTYDNPAIFLAKAANGPQEGGFSITIQGSSFGATEPVFEMFLGNTACEVQKWKDDSTLLCLVRAGFGKVDLSLRLFPDQQLCLGTAGGICTATKAGAFMYDGPHPSALQGPMNGPSSSEQTITVTGSHFGITNPGAFLTASVGRTACSETIWVSPTSLTCKLRPGVGSSDVTVNLGGGERGIKRAFTYNAPTVNAWPVYGGPQAGGVLLTVTGTNFGSSAGLGSSGIFFDAANSPVVQWVSSTHIVIASAPGVKQPAGNFVSIGAPGTPVEELKIVTPWTYDNPMIFGVVPSGVAGLTGNTNITVFGKNFGGLDSSPTVFLGQDQKSCTLTTWSSDSSIACTTPAMPAGKYDVSYLSGAQGNTKAILVAELKTARDVASTSSNNSAINISASFAASAGGIIEYFATPSGVLAFEVVKVTSAVCDQGKILDLGRGVTIDLKPGWCNAGALGGGSSMMVYVLSSANAPFKADATNSTVIATDVIIGLSLSGVALTNPISVVQPLDVNRLASAGSGRRRLLQSGGKKIRQAWLNKCTGRFIPLCETTSNPGSVSSSVTADVAADACFDPSVASGKCDKSVVTAEMCGTGGQILAFGYDNDPCQKPAEPASISMQWGWIIAGIVLGVLGLLCCLFFLYRRMSRREDYDESQDYDSYSDESESGSKPRASADAELVFTKGSGMPLMLFSPVFSQSYPGQMSPGAQASKMFPVSPYGPGAYPGSFVEGGQVAPYDYYGAYGTAGSAPVTDLMTAPGPIFKPSWRG